VDTNWHFSLPNKSKSAVTIAFWQLLLLLLLWHRDIKDVAGALFRIHTKRVLNCNVRLSAVRETQQWLPISHRMNGLVDGLQRLGDEKLFFCVLTAGERVEITVNLRLL